MCHSKLGEDDLFKSTDDLINWKLGWFWTGNRGVREDEGAGCEGCECDARRTGSIFYHCSVLSSLMDPTWAEHSTTFRHIAQAGEGRTEGARGSKRGRQSNTWERRLQKERGKEKVVQNHLPKNNHNPKHANILFHRHAVTAFSITSGPECICRSRETLLIRTARN